MRRRGGRRCGFLRAPLGFCLSRPPPAFGFWQLLTIQRWPQLQRRRNVFQCRCRQSLGATWGVPEHGWRCAGADRSHGWAAAVMCARAARVAACLDNQVVAGGEGQGGARRMVVWHMEVPAQRLRPFGAGPFAAEVLLGCLAAAEAICLWLFILRACAGAIQSCAVLGCRHLS